MTDVELDARVTTLEENGAGNVQNGNSFKLLDDVLFIKTAHEDFNTKQ